ncbi:hypothetical protein OSTOST_21082 [Ostertagia ostertagi]
MPPRASSVKRSTIAAARRLRNESSRLNTSFTITSPLPEKRIPRRPQHYECDTYSTLSRKRCALRRRPALKDSMPLSEENKVLPVPAPTTSRAAPAPATRSRTTRAKTVEKKTETEKKVSKPRARSKKSEPVHGAVCWNNVCDCVLLEILRSQPLVTLLEKKGVSISP